MKLKALKTNMKNWYFMAPDKPSRVGEDFFPEIDSSYIAEVKSDGFRCEVGRFNDKLHFISRNNNELEVSDELIAACASIPNGCAVDTELICHTRIKAINKQFGLKIPLMEKLMIFDVTWLDGDWIGRTHTLEQRRATQLFQSFVQGTLDSLANNDKVFRAPYVSGEMSKALFESQKIYLISEGIVVKKLRSKCIGSRTTSQDSPDWLKIKHRD